MKSKRERVAYGYGARFVINVFIRKIRVAVGENGRITFMRRDLQRCKAVHRAGMTLDRKTPRSEFGTNQKKNKKSSHRSSSSSREEAPCHWFTFVNRSIQRSIELHR